MGRIEREVSMRKIFLAAVVTAAGFSSAALAEGLTVGVSWSNFQ